MIFIEQLAFQIKILKIELISCLNSQLEFYFITAIILTVFIMSINCLLIKIQ